jgi:hypothetical protein
MHRRRGVYSREALRWYDAFENRATSNTRFPAKWILPSGESGEDNTFIEFVLPVGKWLSTLTLQQK